ncbi:hypothetical protein ACP70R_001078 [Stipagrostis hirtigluma subsp. patula]
MDSTLPCLLLLPLPSSGQRHHRKRDHHDGPGAGRGPARVRTSRGNGREFRARALFGLGGGGGGDGLRAVRRMVKLNSAIQNRSVREQARFWACATGATAQGPQIGGAPSWAEEHRCQTAARRSTAGVLQAAACNAMPDVQGLVWNFAQGLRIFRYGPVRELLELLADECLYFLGSLRSLDVSQLGQNMFLLLHAMMLRHQVSFVLKPSPNEAGFDLGIKWSLEWKGKKLPWDLDCNVSTSHVYRGLLLISQVNKNCVPLIQRILGIIQQNLDAVILTIVHKVLPEGTLDENDRSTIIACVIIGLVVMVLFYAIFKNL